MTFCIGTPAYHIAPESIGGSGMHDGVGRRQAPEACGIWVLPKLRVFATEPVRTGQPEFVIGIERCASGPSSGAVRSATPPAYPNQGRRALGLHGDGSSDPAAELLRVRRVAGYLKQQKSRGSCLLRGSCITSLRGKACLLKQQPFADGAREPEDPHMP